MVKGISGWVGNAFLHRFLRWYPSRRKDIPGRAEGGHLQTPSSRKVEVAQCIAALTNLALFLVEKQSCA